MGMALAAEADDRDNAVLDDGQVGVVVVEQLSHGDSPCSNGWVEGYRGPTGLGSPVGRADGAITDAA